MRILRVYDWQCLNIIWVVGFGHHFPDETKKAGKTAYSFVKDGNNYVYSGSAGDLKLVFELKNGKLDLTNLLVKDGSTYNLKTIHYSLKNTGDAFSILAQKNDDDSGKVLLAFSFVKKTEQKAIPKTDSIYKYIYGAGVMVGWDQKEILEVDICGAPSAKIENVYRDGINMTM